MVSASSNRLGPWFLGVALLLGGAAGAVWVVRSSGEAPEIEPEMLGRRWSEAPSAWGPPVCSAGGASISARESAARRPEGDSGLVIPHAELLVDAPRPVHGPGSRASNPFLVFTQDADARAFLQKVSSGTLASMPGEYRPAIDRAGPVRLVTLDGAGRMRRVEVIRPVFITANVAPGG